MLQNGKINQIHFKDVSVCTENELTSTQMAFFLLDSGFIDLELINVLLLSIIIYLHNCLSVLQILPVKSATNHEVIISTS